MGFGFGYGFGCGGCGNGCGCGPCGYGSPFNAYGYNRIVGAGFPASRLAGFGAYGFNNGFNNGYNNGFNNGFNNFGGYNNNINSGNTFATPTFPNGAVANTDVGIRGGLPAGDNCVCN
jgi:hypothetical protein